MNIVKKDLTVNQLLNLPENFIENLTLKQLILPINNEISLFVLQNFQSKWYQSEVYKLVHVFCKAYWEKYQLLPTLKVINQIFTQHEKYVKYLLQFKDLLNGINSINENDYHSQFLIDSIVKFVKERATYFAIMDNINDIEKHNDVKACLSRFEEIVKLELNNDLGIDYFDNLDKHINDLLSPNICVETGLKQLDTVMNGGIPINDTCLLLFMAKPGLGKSMFMINVAANLISQNKKVLVISLEMSEHLYSTRFDAIFSDIDINQLKTATDGLSKRVKAIHTAYPKSGLRIKTFPTGTCSALHIKQYIKKLKDTTDFIPDVIIVDYLGIMKPNNNYDTSSLYTKGKAVAEELRALSTEMTEICGKAIPVISAIQSNRSSGGVGGYAGEDIDIENSAESSGIPATADCMFAIYQKGKEDLDAGIVRLKVIKNRYGGKVGDCFAFYKNNQTLKIEDCYDEYDDESLDTNNNNLITVATNKNSQLGDNTLDKLMEE